ncbi:MAG: energy-coupled thiamine transporter ThiT [Clostridia bacterium]|nr:energy-coupled thiamine transporter ThiT [Clostridia bacterium]
MKSENQKKQTNKTLRLTETAILIAIAVVLNELSVIKFPFGGSVTVFSQVPIILLAFRYGTPWGILSGIIMGIFQMMFGLKNFSYVTGIGAYIILAFSDYICAFGVLGLGGAFKNKIKSQPIALVCGGVLASALRLAFHFISGVTIWSSYAPSNTIGAIIKYSITYNSSYMIPELIVTVIGLFALGKIFDFTSQDITAKIKEKAE